jgi:hypothetical protein
VTKHFASFLKIVAVSYVLGFGSMSVRRFLDQRDQIVQIQKVEATLKAIELQGSVHCDPS